MDRNKVKAVVVLGILVCILVACREESSYAPTSPVVPAPSLTDNTPTGIVFLPSKVVLTETPIATATIAPSTATHMAWYTTALAFQRTEAAERQNFWNSEATQRAQFLVSCDDSDLEAYDFQVSTNGEWIAVSCGNKSRQKIIVQNKEGVRWSVKPEDFPNIENNYGWLKPKFWGLDGQYLFLTRTFARSGGGDECFGGGGEYALFQLDLKNGSWVTIISPTNGFPGYDIHFSPTGRRYAVNIEGITIADFKSGEVVKVDAHGVIDLSWSPDGRYLAYSVAACDESGQAKLASVYIWDSQTSREQLLFSYEKLILNLELWLDDSTLRVLGKKLVKTEDVRIVNGFNVCPCYNYVYDVYLYDISKGDFIFSGTATPYP